MRFEKAQALPNIRRVDRKGIWQERFSTVLASGNRVTEVLDWQNDYKTLMSAYISILQSIQTWNLADVLRVVMRGGRLYLIRQDMEVNDEYDKADAE